MRTSVSQQACYLLRSAKFMPEHAMFIMYVLIVFLVGIPQIISARSIDVFISKLDSHDKEERLEAARESLINELTATTEEVRKIACDALFNLGDPSVIPDLMAASDKNSYTSAAILRFGPQAVPYLLDSIRSENHSVRETAAYLLGELRDRRAITRLVEALADTPGNAPAALLKYGDEAARELIGGLKSEDKSIRKACMQLLGEIGNPQAVVPLIKVITSEKEEASGALIRIGRAGVSELNKYVRSSDDALRRNIAYVIGRIADSRSLSVLLSALDDSSPGIVKDAIYALGLIGYRSAIPVIVKKLESNHPLVREESKRILIGFGGKYLIPKLQKRYSYFIKWLDRYIELLASQEKYSPKESSSEAGPSIREKVIRSRIRLYKILTLNDEAIKAFAELKQETVLDERDHFHLARLYHQTGKKRRMVTELQESLMINPDYEKVLAAIKKLGYEYKRGRLHIVQQ